MPPDGRYGKSRSSSKRRCRHAFSSARWRSILPSSAPDEHQEFIRFLNAVEAAVPAGKLVHAVLDNYGTHKHAKVLAWLERHPRWTFHFTPTSASWLNAVEGFFAKLTKRRLRRGVFGSLVELQA